MPHTLKDTIPSIAETASVSAIEDVLRLLAERFPGHVTFSTSFSYEDQVITHKILTNNLPIRIFTLDTGVYFLKHIPCGGLPTKNITHI